MSKPFDAALKSLLEASPRDWPALAGYPVEAAEVIDADIATVSGAADKVLRIPGPVPWLMHVEFQAGPDSTLPRRGHRYNALLDGRHDLPVKTVVILLRPQADLANLTGVYGRHLPGESAYLNFRYQVIRVWQLPVERVLASGLGTLALAPLSAVSEAELPAVIQRMRERLRGRRDALDLWTAAYVLMGLRYEQALINQLLQGVVEMEESVTYQAIVAKGLEQGRAQGLEQGRAQGLAQGRAEGERQGALRELRKTLLLIGRERFGEPDARVAAAIEAIDDVETLEQLMVRLFHIRSWQELLPGTSAGTRRRTPPRGRGKSKPQ